MYCKYCLVSALLVGVVSTVSSASIVNVVSSHFRVVFGNNIND